ncbi:TPR repeat protein [Fulvivirga imtechensis AK7]|uniref:TPR repeat protein n=1 Tax=Fulvivirga imtechensis AK7 TaxID=1237149 RepID=L8JQS1_9BACT|nr:tetratricopeptide repeat protein [Fulvivirga imtechensis]ELR69824.1 TPR repeat protein [Fulvivirga imtechensis AK7]
MLKTRIILLISAVVLVVLIFSLPKVVIDNDPDEMASNTTEAEATDKSPDAAAPAEDNVHDQQLSVEAQKEIQNLKEKFAASKNIEKSVIFADSLAELYLSVNKYDSAAKFLDIIAENSPGEDSWLRAGNAYYEGFTYSMEPAKRTEMATKAREYFEKVLKDSPDRLDVKNKLAMTHLSSSSPMKGIMMLREILEQDPGNEKALFNLGALSMQSNQYDKAIERFSKLVELYPNNTQAHFFLAVSYMETGKKAAAKEHFEIVKQLDDDPQLQATVDSYLEEIE